MARQHDNAQRIARTSAVLRQACVVMMVAVIAIPAAFWTLAQDGSGVLPTYEIGYSLTPATRVMAFMVTLLPGLLLVRALAVLRRLFGLYRDGAYFSAANVACFRQLGWTAIGWVAAQFVFGGVLSVALTANNGPGERVLALTAKGADVTALFAGVVLLVISWVMDEARRLDEDQAQII